MYNKILKTIKNTKNIENSIMKIIKEKQNNGYETYNGDNDGIYKSFKINNKIKKEYIKKYFK